MAPRPPQDGPRWAQVRPRRAKDGSGWLPKGKASEQHRIYIAIFPFFEDVPSEIALFSPPKPPETAPGWPKMAPRPPQDAPRWAHVRPRWPKDGSRRPLEGKTSEQHRIYIAIFPFFADVPSEIAILRLPKPPKTAPRWPKMAPRPPQDHPRWAHVWPRWPKNGSRRPLQRKTSEQHGMYIAIFPFFEDVPSEIAILEPLA